MVVTTTLMWATLAQLLRRSFLDLLDHTDGIQMAQRLYAEARLLLQLVSLTLVGNRLDGTLPSSWAGLTQASPVSNATSSLQFIEVRADSCCPCSCPFWMWGEIFYTGHYRSHGVTLPV